MSTMRISLAHRAATSSSLRSEPRRAPFVLATVVRAERPTSAKAGDRAIVLPDGTIEGFVGGACAESTVRLQGLRLLTTRRVDAAADHPDRRRGQPPTAQDGDG